MSKLYYDHLIILDEVEVAMDQLELDSGQRRELEQLIEEMTHHRILERVLDVLPRSHHEEFLEKFTKNPHDQMLIEYLDERIEESVEEHIKDEVEKLKQEILEDLKA